MWRYFLREVVDFYTREVPVAKGGQHARSDEASHRSSDPALAHANHRRLIMRIAIVGATGRIGAKLTRGLLSAGHQVKALSRGGPALDALVQLGAVPFLEALTLAQERLGSSFRMPMPRS